MSLDTLIQAVHYVEMQEKQKQALPPSVSVYQQAPQSITVTTPIRIKQESVVTTSPPLLQVQTTATTPATPIAAVAATTTASAAAPTTHRIIHNSFDLINPLIIDNGEVKRKRPPMAFSFGTREVHNKLEKNRRAHLKQCFDALKKKLNFSTDEKKTSNLNILHSAQKTIVELKKKERQLEHEMERLAREKIALQQRFALLKKDSLHDVEFSLASEVKEEVTTEPMDHSSVAVRDLPVQQISNTAKNSEAILARAVSRPLPVTLTTNSITNNGIKEITTITQQQPHQPPQQVQTTALSVLPLGYHPVNQSLVLQKVIMPKGLTAELTQLVSSAAPPVAHFIAAAAAAGPQQLGTKVVPLMNAHHTQYVVKPLVVVSTPSRSS